MGPGDKGVGDLVGKTRILSIEPLFTNFGQFLYILTTFVNCSVGVNNDCTILHRASLCSSVLKFGRSYRPHMGRKEKRRILHSVRISLGSAIKLDIAWCFKTIHISSNLLHVLFTSKEFVIITIELILVLGPHFPNKVLPKFLLVILKVLEMPWL